MNDSSHAQGAPQAPRFKRVLMINSYSLDYTWTENIVSGLRSTLMPRGDVELAFEFMDTKRVPFNDRYAAVLRDLMQPRYARIKLDAIVASDDDALDFLLRYRDELFPGVPVVFCGVNNFEDKRIAGHTGFTGVNETVDVERTLGTVHDQRPAARRVLVVHDQTATGLSMARRIQKVADTAPQGFQFEFLTRLTWDELGARLRGAPLDSVILWAVHLRDRDEQPRSARESLRFTAQAAPVPVYSLWDFSVQEGVVGGRVTSGRAQGESAGRMVGRILEGMPVSAISILRESPNEYMFDHTALQRFGIPEARLPDGAVVLHRPFSFYQAYKGYVWAALLGMGGETIVIVGLLFALRALTHKSRARLRASEQRYRSIAERQQKILDSMSEGLLVTDLHGRLAPVESAAIVRWFGALPAGAPVWDALCGEDPRARMGFELGFEQLAADLLPYELLADQLPKHLQHGDRHYELAHRPILQDGVLRELLITVSDITARLHQESAEKRLRELPAIIGNLMRDRAGFLGFIDDAEHLIATLSGTASVPEQKRIVHTLKGNTSIYGFLCFAERCHALESVMLAEERGLRDDDIAELEAEWGAALKEVRVFLGGETSDVQLARSEYDDLLRRLEARQDHLRLMQVARGWQHPPLQQVLEVHERAGARLAGRLGKSVKVEISTDKLRMSDERIRPFLATLVHLVRNAIDHGIEAPDKRREAGKPETGSLALRARLENDRLIVSVEDDGRGIDWDALRRRAEQLGLPSGAHDDLVAAMFTEGVSTAASVSDVSGRGVGLAAVGEAARALGGTMTVESHPGRGTRFVFSLPAAEMVETAVPRSARIALVDGGTARRTGEVPTRPRRTGELPVDN